VSRDKLQHAVINWEIKEQLRHTIILIYGEIALYLRDVLGYLDNEGERTIL
jgi:hypothetical protein